MNYPVMPGYGSIVPASSNSNGCGCGYTFAPVESPPPTIFEQQRAQLYRHEEESNGKMKGAAVGGMSGIATGALAGAALLSWSGPGAIAGAAVGALVGGILGLFGGGLAGKKLAAFQAVEHDAADNGKLDGSPLLLHGQGGHESGSHASAASVYRFGEVF